MSENLWEICVATSLHEMTANYVLWPASFRSAFVELPNITTKDVILLLTRGNPVICPLWFSGTICHVQSSNTSF